MKLTTEGFLRLGLWAALYCVILAFGFWITPDEPRVWINKIYGTNEYSNLLYWNLHPMNVFDYIGLTLHAVGLSYITGGYYIFLGEKYLSKGEVSWVGLGVGFVIGGLGLALCYIK